jgi:hypothetical protein
MIGALALLLLAAAGLFIAVGSRRRGGQLLGFGLGLALLGPLAIAVGGPFLRLLAPVLALALVVVVALAVIRGWLSFRANRAKLDTGTRRTSTSLKRRAE